MKAHPTEDIAIVTLDAEKDFDNVSFKWLEFVLEKCGFSGSFVHFKDSLYSSPSARVVSACHFWYTTPFTKAQDKGAPYRS